MACLSPSPSGRRLSELLEEKQEPFLLDIHLLEKGCPSSRLLDGYDTATCWPAPGNAAVLKRLTSKKNKAKAASSSRGGKKKPAGILKLLLSKILQSTVACSRRPPALQYCDSFKIAATVAPAPSRHSDSGSCSDSESSYSSSDDDDEKQLSPVSVLMDHPFESSPVHAKLSPASCKLSPSKTAAMDMFRELLDAAYSPALLTQLLANAKSDDLSAKDAAAYDDDDEYYYGYRTSPKNDDAAYWEAELARVSALVASEVPNLRLDAAAESEDVGASVADAVLQTLMKELVVDLGSS